MPADELSAQRRCHQRLREICKIIDDQIGDNRSIFGDQLSATDIYPFMLTTWLKRAPGHHPCKDF